MYTCKIFKNLEFGAVVFFNSVNERRRNKITTIKSGVNGKGLGSDPFHLIAIFQTGKGKCTRNITTNNKGGEGGVRSYVVHKHMANEIRRAHVREN